MLRGTAAIAVVACAAAVGTTASSSAASSTPAAAALAATSTVFPAVEDSYVSTKYPASNFGTSSVLTAGSAPGDNKIIFVKFAVSAVPAGSTGISATLRLNRTQHHLPPTVEGSVVPTTTWSEGTINYTNRPSRGPGLGVRYPTTASAFVEWPVAVTGNGAYAFSVQSAATTDTARFNAREGVIPRSTLTVTFTPPPPPPSASQVWIGATCNKPDATISTFNACNASIGSLKFRRSFNSSLPASWASSSGSPDAANGYRSFVSWKPPGGDVVGAAAGNYDSAITAWAKSVPTTGVYATSYHEPENDMTAAQFVAFQRHVYTVVKAANSTIQWGPVYMSYWWQPTRLASIGGAAAWWVGNDKSDFTAVDNYSTPTPIELSKDVQFMTWYNFMLGTGKPLLITEYGQYSIRPGYGVDPAMQAKRATTITADAAWIKAQGKIKMWLYWNGTGAQGDWTLTDTASRIAWKDVAAVGRTS